MKFLIGLAGVITTVPFLLALLIMGAFFFYLGKLVRNDFLRLYGLALAYSVDQMANAVIFGKPDETISMRTAKALKSGRPKWFVKGFGKMVDWLAIVVAGDQNHIKKSITDETGTRELWSWIRSKEKESFFAKIKRYVIDFFTLPKIR